MKLIKEYLTIRRQSEDICCRLATEDFVVQPVPEVSPPKWHLAHISWFFEELILCKNLPGYQRFNQQYAVLFNSYYKAAGEHWIQGERGQLSRPSVEEVYAYRRYVDEHMVTFLENHKITAETSQLLILGLHHEQQHQELLLMDIKYILGMNPIEVKYSATALPEADKPLAAWSRFQEGTYQIGHQGTEFSFDNERPKHTAYLHKYGISESLVSNGEYLEFINSKDYNNHKLWLSLGWDWKNKYQIKRPLYWRDDKKEGLLEFTLHGVQRLDLNKPVAHISYFEADAFAAWKGCRLPTEFEAEQFLNNAPNINAGKSSSEQLFHANDANQITDQLWFWTSSHYSPYPGFRPFSGMVEEYNGKFMCQQFVLKGGCIATPQNHYRHSYRNFYFPEQRWMFSGIRLTRDI
ncbi:ergothioneine biosynthesis protein EgtB [Neptunomonas sp.]|uniref:ergothioneine biosynthesis protein EgtB n=1 Tax=Neptunomonas sp. TaxID=1971898 RepID=UPI0035655D11